MRVLNKITSLFFGIAALPAAILAAPMISVDSVNFDIGTIREGEMKVVKHTFKVKNTGDSALVIQQVKPG